MSLKPDSFFSKTLFPYLVLHTQMNFSLYKIYRMLFLLVVVVTYLNPPITRIQLIFQIISLCTAIFSLEFMGCQEFQMFLGMLGISWILCMKVLAYMCTCLCLSKIIIGVRFSERSMIQKRLGGQCCFIYPLFPPMSRRSQKKVLLPTLTLTVVVSVSRIYLVPSWIQGQLKKKSHFTKK